MDTLTFALAMAGYLGLALSSVLIVHGRLGVRFWQLVTAIIVAHVLMVWWVRYGWDPAQATRRGPAGFIVFHSALAMVLLSLRASEKFRRNLILLSFAIVTIGALGATARDSSVAMYRVPVAATSLLGLAGITAGIVRRRRTVRRERSP